MPNSLPPARLRTEKELFFGLFACSGFFANQQERPGPNIQHYRAAMILSSRQPAQTKNESSITYLPKAASITNPHVKLGF
jgi:hypothetical protein